MDDRAIISADRRIALDGENTYRLELIMVPSTVDEFVPGSEYTFDSQTFDITGIERQLQQDGTFLINIDMEHISYRLQDMQYIRSDVSGAVWQLNELVKQASTTGKGGNFEGIVNSVNSSNIPDIKILNKGSNYAVNDVITVRGETSGATARFKITSLDGSGVGSFDTAPPEGIPNPDPNAKWTTNTNYQQVWTSGNGQSFTCNCYYVDADNNPKFAIVNRGVGYAKGDTIIVGNASAGPLASITVEYIGWLAPGWLTINNYSPTAVGGISGITVGTEIPEDEEEINRDNFQMTGTVDQIIAEILNKSGFMAGPISSESVSFSSSATSRRELLYEFLDYIQDNGVITVDVMFNNKMLVVITNGTGDSFTEYNVKTFSSSYNSHNKNEDNEVEISYSIEPILYKDYTLGGLVDVSMDTVGVTADNLRIISVSYNPYDLTDCKIEVANPIKKRYRNLLDTITQNASPIVTGTKSRGFNLIKKEVDKLKDDISNDFGNKDDRESGGGGSGGGGGGSGAFVILDHKPKQSEVDEYDVDTVILVYDPNVTVQPAPG